MEVPRVPGPSKVGSDDADRVWMLDDGALLLHHRNVQKYGRCGIKGCPWCKRSMAAILIPVPEETREREDKGDDVVQGAGADEEEAAPPAPDSWWTRPSDSR